MTLRADEMQALLLQHFAQEGRLLEVHELSLSAARTDWLPERNCLVAAFDIGACDRIFGAR